MTDRGVHKFKCRRGLDNSPNVQRGTMGLDFEIKVQWSSRTRMGLKCFSFFNILYNLLKFLVEQALKLQH